MTETNPQDDKEKPINLRKVYLNAVRNVNRSTNARSVSYYMYEKMARKIEDHQVAMMSHFSENGTFYGLRIKGIGETTIRYLERALNGKFADGRKDYFIPSGSSSRYRSYRTGRSRNTNHHGGHR